MTAAPETPRQRASPHLADTLALIQQTNELLGKSTETEPEPSTDGGFNEDEWAHILSDKRATTEEPKSTFLDWPAFLDEDFGRAEFVAGDVIQPGQQAALVGDGKVGKSLLALEWAQAISTGKRIYGGRQRKPYRVLYVDCENSWPDIQDRARSLGFSPEDLAGVLYLSFPGMPPLDTPEGGEALRRYVDKAEAEVVFLDTVSRMISGKENDSDTWLDLYRCTSMKLKRDHIASVRLDHFGKDSGRGARGSSAKTQDVDAVWEMSVDGKVGAAGTPIRLFRTHTRSGLGRATIDLWRQGRKIGDGDTERWAPGETRHVLRDRSGAGESDFEVAKHLAALAVELDLSPRAGRDAIKASVMKAHPDRKHANSVWEEAARIYKRERGTAPGSSEDDE